MTKDMSLALTVPTIGQREMVGGSDYLHGGPNENVVRLDGADERPSEHAESAGVERDQGGLKIVRLKTTGDTTGKYKDLGGSDSGILNYVLLQRALEALPSNTAEAEREALPQAALDALRNIGPRDAIEGMMAVQIVATHFAAMDCLRRAHIEDQSFDVRRENLNQATKLSRNFAMLNDALHRHRGKGQNAVVKQIHEQEDTVGVKRGSRVENEEQEKPHG